MADHLAASGHAIPDQDLGALEAASRTLGWDGDVLPELTLLGCRVIAVPYLREDVHPGPRRQRRLAAARR